MSRFSLAALLAAVFISCSSGGRLRKRDADTELQLPWLTTSTTPTTTTALPPTGLPWVADTTAAPPVSAAPPATTLVTTTAVAVAAAAAAGVAEAASAGAAGAAAVGQAAANAAAGAVAGTPTTPTTTPPPPPTTTTPIATTTPVTTTPISVVATTSLAPTMTTTTAPSRPPRVYFLFLAVDKISNIEVWKHFFFTAPKEEYRAYVHCKTAACNQSVANTPIIPVRTWPSYYCTDLVSPMQQLLSTAIDDTGPRNLADKFAFVSDSTLPAKPFQQMYATLVPRNGSDFCTFPSSEWADVQAGGHLKVAVKFHQWITLDRVHAEKAVSLWDQGFLHDFMRQFALNTVGYSWPNSFADHRNFGCLDEFWHMAALYGPIANIDRSVNALVHLQDWSGPPLQVNPSVGWQGTCDTFVLWSQYLHQPSENLFSKLYSSLDASSKPHMGNHARPGWWDTISTTGIRAIRYSDFLFVRKFIDNPHLVDAQDFSATYSKLVLE